MAAIPLNLLLKKGTDFDATFNIQNEDNTTPLNLTGYTAELRCVVAAILLVLQILLLVLLTDIMVF